MGYKTMFLEKILGEVNDQERNVYRHLEVMNHLTSMKIAWDNLVPVNVLRIKTSAWVGVLNHFAERLWGTKTCSVFKDGV